MLAFRLCLAFGWPFIHPDRLLAFFSPDELEDWAEFYREEPWGFELDDSRFGQLCAVIARSQGAKVTASDFMFRPPAEKASEGLSAESISAMLGLAPPPKPQTSTAREKLNANGKAR